MNDIYFFFFWINRNAKGEYRNSTQVVSQEEFLYREKIKISILCIQFPRSCTIYHYAEVSRKFINRNSV